MYPICSVFVFFVYVKKNDCVLITYRKDRKEERNEEEKSTYICTKNLIHSIHTLKGYIFYGHGPWAMYHPLLPLSHMTLIFLPMIDPFPRLPIYN